MTTVMQRLVLLLIFVLNVTLLVMMNMVDTAHQGLKELSLIDQKKLTHIVMPFVDRDVSRALKNLKLWKDRFEPVGIYETDLVLYMSGSRNESAVELIESALGTDFVLPYRIVFAEIPPALDTYYGGTRLQFERMLSKQVDLTMGDGKSTQWVLYMEPDCLPVQRGWLGSLQMLLMREQKHCKECPWVIGSGFRGQSSVMVVRDPAYLFHINGNALYDLTDSGSNGSSALSQWYFGTVRPFIEKNYKEHAYDTDMFKCLLDASMVSESLQVAHRFRFTNLIQNRYHSWYNGTDGDAVLIHGGRGPFVSMVFS